MASLDINKILQSRLDHPEKLTNIDDTGPDFSKNIRYQDTNVSTISKDCLKSTRSTIPEDCSNKIRTTLSEDCPKTKMSTSVPIDFQDKQIPSDPGSHKTVSTVPPTSTSILDIPEGYPEASISSIPASPISISSVPGVYPATHTSSLSGAGGSGGFFDPTISTISSTKHLPLENPPLLGYLEKKPDLSLLSTSGCCLKKVYNKDNILSKDKSQERLDFLAKKMPRDAVNGIVQMASIMAATLESSKSPSKSCVSSLEVTSLEQDEKHSETDFLGEGMDSQTLWETFKILAEKSLRNFSDKKPSRWKTVRHMVQWTPFIQTYKKKRYPWVQLAGHSGNFKAGNTQGTVLKKLCPAEETCYRAIMKDNIIKDLVPQYHGSITMDGDEQFIELQDCLSTFTTPCIMDCKVGVRTYLEEELTKARQKPTLRKDMYEKMVSVDPFAPTDEEHRQQGVTKPRYMVWRETISSTATLGFRIEGIKKAGVDFPSKDFKTTKTKEHLMESFKTFLTGYPAAAAQYIQRLQVIKKSLEKSPFFNSQEVIGSSLLFVHDQVKSNIWMIDFGKTAPVPGGITVDHRSPWQVGNHEDGYLSGIDNIINIFQQIQQG